MDEIQANVTEGEHKSSLARDVDVLSNFISVREKHLCEIFTDDDCMRCVHVVLPSKGAALKQ